MVAICINCLLNDYWPITPCQRCQLGRYQERDKIYALFRQIGHIARAAINVLVPYHSSKLCNSFEDLISSTGADFPMNCKFNNTGYQMPISRTIFHPNWNSTENMFSCNSILGYHIATKFCTCHDDITVVPCAKLHSDYFTSTWMRAKLNLHRIWITMEKSLVKYAPEL